MLAILKVQLPFLLLIPEGITFQMYGFTYKSYDVEFAVLSRSDFLDSPQLPKATIDAAAATFADEIQIFFRKSTFDRHADHPVDPPLIVLASAVQFFIDRLRFFSGAAQVTNVNLMETHWAVLYLNDDFSPLATESNPKILNVRGYTYFSNECVICDPKLWQAMHTQPAEFQPPQWHTLLVDAKRALPHIGSAVVLAATALEVFIATVLNQLQLKSNVPDATWRWMNERKNRLNNPSVEEQFTDLLTMVCGKSLKQQKALWADFMDLKNARNKFAHEGVASIAGVEVSLERAGSLIVAAQNITKTIREWLPQELQWPIFEMDKHTVSFTFSSEQPSGKL